MLSEDTTVSRFDRMPSRHKLLQSQLPPLYDNVAMRAGKILESVRGEWFSASLIAGSSPPDPRALPAQAKLLLATGPPGIRSRPSLASFTHPHASAFHASPSPSPLAVDSRSDDT